MKKKIAIGLIILTISFAAGGLYIIRSIDRVVLELETVITLHQVEILRKTLLGDIIAVQQDLLLKDSPHDAGGIDTFVNHAETMEEAVESCFECHHDDPAESRLKGMRGAVHRYQKALSSVHTLRANLARVTREKQIAYHIGQQIIADVDEIIDFSTGMLSDRTQAASHSIADTRRLLMILVLAAPIVALAVALFFIRDFTGSVEALIRATRRLKAGDLEYKIDGLQDEFGELGDSFNEMALALRDMIHKIEESQKRYRMLFESAGDAIFMLEAEGEDAGRIVSANQAAADMHGYTVDELLDLNIRDLDTPEAAAEMPERIGRILNGEWIDEQISHRRKDGTVFPVELSAGLLEFENQRHILAFDKDITERKEAEDALQRAEQLAIVGEMAAGLAHEIKNPLTGIKVSMEVLSSELDLTREDAEVFKRVSNEINRISTLLRNLLNYAKPPAPQFTSIDVNKVIASAVQTAEFSLRSPAPELESRKIRFVQDLSDRLPMIGADSAQLQQVILNLLLNAIHAIPESGTISVKTSADLAGSIRIVVSDTGKGIGEQEISRIFQPFFTTKPKGTGLGLSICKRLIEQQNGTIHVARNPEGGLMFAIDLPVEQQSGVNLQ